MEAASRSFWTWSAEVVSTARAPLSRTMELSRVCAPEGLGGIRRHGRHARIEAAEEGRDEVEARRVEKESALTPPAVLLKGCADRPGLGIQGADGQPLRLRLPIFEEAVKHLPRLPDCALLQQVDQTGWDPHFLSIALVKY
jgi:hypothetical protein